MKNSKRDILISIMAFLLALGITVFILKWDKHSLEIDSLGVFILKLIPYLLAITTLAFFPLNRIPMVLKHCIGLLSFGIIFCYFIGKLILFYFTEIEYEMLYLHLQLMTPFILLVITASFRCGGFSKKDTFVFGGSALLFMLSGIEDLGTMYLFSKAIPDYNIPEVWDYVNHMTIRAGRPLTKHEAYVFILSHLLLAGLIIYLSYAKKSPMKWLIKKIRKKLHSKV